MVSRKRAREEAEEDDPSVRVVIKRNEPLPSSSPQDGVEHGLLHQLRNMWEFSNLIQFIYSFGKAVKISGDIDIDELESECLKPGPSEKLLDIGLTLLKFVSSHRGLTYENFEDYTRRQYLAKAPSRNPFGDAEEPIKFHDLDLFQRIRVLQQLSVWTFWNPDRIRERMPESKETDQIQWRVDEIGYDRDERLYYVLDDNRLYRRTDPPIPAAKAAKPKANSKKGRALARAARKRKLSGMQEEDDEEPKNDANGDVKHDSAGGYKWECIAITLAQYNAFLDTIRRSKDPNEEFLRDQLVENVIPVIEKAEESHRRKMERREKELLSMQLMANAKRSSRIASKQERERQEMEAAEEARKRGAERIAALKELEKQKKIEKERLYRMMTREQRLKDREEKRKLHEEELAKIAEEAKKIESGESRMSERHLKAEMEKRKKDIEALQNEEQWTFDCSGCGVHGENLDDGSHIVACEKCNVWQHIKCLGIPQDEAEKDNFHFICRDCQRRIEEANLPKIPPLKFRVGASSSPPFSSKQKANGERRKRQDTSTSPSFKKSKRPSTAPSQPPVTLSPLANGHPPPTFQQGHHLPPPQSNLQPGQPTLPPSPQRPLSQSKQNGFYHLLPVPQPVLNHQPQSISSSLSPSPLPPPNNMLSNGLPPPKAQLLGPAPQFLHYQPPGLYPNPNTSSFISQRPSSSPSTQGDASRFLSPIQNRPTMSPTQGNRDVGPLAGFPPSSTVPNTAHSVPLSFSPRVNDCYSPPRSHTTTTPSYSIPRPSSQGSHSFISTPTNPTVTPSRNTFAHSSPPAQQYPSQTAPPTSGLSPTKHSPAHPQPPLPSTATSSSPFSSFSTSGSINATPTQPPILPPIQRLQPSPKLMSGASPDAPVRVPVKSMTPEQEDRRRREDEMAAAAAGRGSQGAGGYIWGQVSVPREGEGQMRPYSSFDETKKQLVGSGFRPQVGPGQQPQSQPGPQPELQQPPPRQQQQ
ncbi:PHD finger domain-containing protein [Histoplasma capsulatum G186AR]|uniref:PHD finger domain-containing protein n=1 Tax=Ajellomyces capsulatus TaxID=5037 RepID=A0A8H8D4G2_AJECA|nr:PHD finger domain-containing protein [Histoplasma capsulatum]QSS67884.1 PHD finger domain-containing protein [Histoplasma capsulatum G186AR]